MSRDQNAAMGKEQKRRPQDGRSYGEMVIEVARAGAELGSGLPEGIEAPLAEGFVRLLIVMREIEAMFNQRGARVSVVAHAIAAHPRINERQGKNKKANQSIFKRVRLAVRISVQRIIFQPA